MGKLRDLSFKPDRILQAITMDRTNDVNDNLR